MEQPPAVAPGPRVLLISLDLKPEFDEVYKPHLRKLTAKATVQRAKNPNEAILALYDQPPFTAVLVTDNTMVKRRQVQVYETLLEYVRRGGTAILMGDFPSSTRPMELRGFFFKAHLPWEAGSFLQETFKLNNAALGVDEALAAKLPRRYSQKAFALKNARPEESWYHSDEEAMAQLFAWPSEAVLRRSMTPVAVGRVGDGKLAYLGDVNVEDGTGDVILALCGLL